MTERLTLRQALYAILGQEAADADLARMETEWVVAKALIHAAWTETPAKDALRRWVEWKNRKAAEAAWSQR